jgi:hypothetical protein
VVCHQGMRSGLTTPPKAINGRRSRTQTAAVHAIESLILLPDEIDEDPDLEEYGDGEHDGREPDETFADPTAKYYCAGVPQPLA